MSLQEDSLRDSGVLNAALNDVNSIVIKVVVYDALADSIVLGCIFDDWLLEVGLEVENLSVVLKPLGSNFRNGVVLLLRAFGDAGEILGNTFAH